MADNTNVGSSGALPADDNHGMPSGYESPVFDLHAMAPPKQSQVSSQSKPESDQATQLPRTNFQVVPDRSTTRFSPVDTTSAGRVRVGEETIQIAPHPTTNRYPWASVHNPTVPVYGDVQQTSLPEPDLVLEPETGQPVLEAPVPSPPASRPPTPPSPPEPEPELHSEPVPEPLTEPVASPVVTPPPEPPPVAQPEPVAPPEVQEPITQPVQPPPEPEPTLPPPQSPSSSKPVPRSATQIFSEHTREVWRVIRPGGAFRGMLIMMMLAFAAFIVYLVLLSLGSGDLDKIPIISELLKR